MIREWNNSLVGKDEYESKHPQLEPRPVRADPQALRISRSDRSEPAVTVLLKFNAFKSGNSGTSTITVSELNHGRLTGDTVRFRSVEAFDGFTSSNLQSASGYSITKVNDDTYTFSAGSETATSGNTTGGGGVASAGPVTVSA
jgi:hypothetical protein|tara:strand:+ start:1010 stop:1438 length:429 start_codon:yes stop_codon:yes gene_type:complete